MTGQEYILRRSTDDIKLGGVGDRSIVALPFRGTPRS